MSSWEEVVQSADRAFENQNIKECHEILKKADENGIHHPQLSWRYARSFHGMAEETTEKKIREKYLVDGLQWARKALEKDPESYSTHMWVGILLGARNEFISSKEKVANAYIIRDHFLKSLELNGNNATALHCMGMWCWNVLQISWVERKAATLLFGTPPTSTYEECLKFLIAADSTEPSIRNCIAIGNVHMQQSNKKEAKVWYQKAMELPAGTQVHIRHQAEAQKKLALC